MKWTDANNYCSRKGTDLQLVVLKDDETIVRFGTKFCILDISNSRIFSLVLNWNIDVDVYFTTLYNNLVL